MTYNGYPSLTLEAHQFVLINEQKFFALLRPEHLGFLRRGPLALVCEDHSFPPVIALIHSIDKIPLDEVSATMSHLAGFRSKLDLLIAYCADHHGSTCETHVTIIECERLEWMNS